MSDDEMDGVKEEEEERGMSRPESASQLSGDDDDDGDDRQQDDNNDKPKVPLTVGRAVWAKVRTFPAWPGVLASPADYGDTAPLQPKPHNVLVHFFGTYDITWVESMKKVYDYDEHFESFAPKSKQRNFLTAIDEAKHYSQTGQLPKRMTGEYDPNEDPSPVKRGRRGRRTRDMDLLSDGQDVPRRVKIARQLGLLPPLGISAMQ